MTPQPRCTAPTMAAYCRGCRFNPLNQLKQPTRGTVLPRPAGDTCRTRSPLPGGV